MNALPPSRSGEGSATNMVSRYVGAAVGVAVVGTVFASVYARRVVAQLGDLDRRTVAEARSSLHAALVRARELGGDTGERVAADARRAFEVGMSSAFVLVATLCAMGGLVTVLVRRRLRGAASEDPD
jgi:hypothetical protein